MSILRIFLFAILAQLATAQQPAPATLQGIVVQAGTGNPLGDVRVVLNAVSGPATNDGLEAPWVVTGPDGRFSFPRLTPSSYRMLATSRGYANAEYGQTQPSGPTSTLTVTPGQRL